MLYREIIAVCSQIHTNHINTVCVGRIWNLVVPEKDNALFCSLHIQIYIRNPLIFQTYEPSQIPTSRTSDLKHVQYRKPKHIGHHSTKCVARTPDARDLCTPLKRDCKFQTKPSSDAGMQAIARSIYFDEPNLSFTWWEGNIRFRNAT